MAKRLYKNDMFFGLTLTDEQKEFVEAIYGDKYDIIWCNAKAGTGKSTLAVACAKLMVSEKRYDGMYYIFSGVEESRYGYRPGTQEEKERSYLLPLYDALIAINEQPEKAINSINDIKTKKESVSWIEPMSHTFLRGGNISHKVVILDETQNWTLHEIKKVLTRCHSDCKIICLGHTGQIDLTKKSASGFAQYIEHFKDVARCKICTLNQNFRGWVAQHADELDG